VLTDLSDRVARCVRDKTVLITGGAGTGRIDGPLTVRGGSGKETFIPGFFSNGTAAPAPEGLKVGGDLTFNARAGGTAPGVGDVMDTGVTLLAPPPLVVGGNLNTTAVDTVALSGNTRVGRDVSVSAAGERPLFVLDVATVTGNVTITGTLTAGKSAGNDNPTGDVVEVGNQGGFLTGTAFVGQALQISTPGPGNSEVVVDASTTVGDSTTINSGDGNNLFILDGTFADLGVTAGNGANSLDFDAAASANSLSVTFGNGNNTIGAPVTVGGFVGTNFSGAVAGDLTFNLGNGNNTVTVVNAPGGTLFWTSGNGTDSVTFAPTTAGQTWSVDMTFGTGTNTLNLAGTGNPEFITGAVRGSGGADTFIQGPNWVIVPPFDVSSF
jgi:hypothetical protein